MSAEVTERDVEARARLVRWFYEHLTHDAFMKSTDDDFADAFLASDWYAERIAQARREGAAEALASVEAEWLAASAAALRSDA